MARLVKITMEGRVGLYLFCFLLQLITVFLTLISTFMTKVLVDCLTGDIFVPEQAGPIETIIANIFGGPEYLTNNYWVFCIIVVLLGMATSLFYIVRHLMNAEITTHISKNLRLILFDHIERLPYGEQKKNKNGDLIQTCTRDADVLRKFVTGETLLCTYTFFLVLLSFLILLSINWMVALSSIVLLPIMFVYSFFLIKGVRKRYRVTDDSEGLMTAKIEESLSAVRVIKAYNNEHYEIDDFEKYLDDYKKKFIHWRKLSSFFFSSSDIFVFGQITIATLFSIYLASNGTISIGTLYIAFTFTNFIVWPVRDVATVLSNLARALVSVDRMDLILKEPIEDTTSGLKPTISGNIEFKDTSFYYEDDKKLRLDHINLKINKGETLAIMGKTGSGKSTMISLLSRLYDYTDGEILLDNVPLKEIEKNYLRRNVATVLQEPFLFSKTIADNLKIANKEASDEKIYNAAKIADIHNSIIGFRDGYHTPVGEKGVTLSGGQKQRLAIARTIVSDAPILIFDDSLSAVDTETDINIRSALKRRQSKSTTLIITHRIATAKDADHILVLENGKIAEYGTHDQLIKNDGLYHRIYDIQTRMV